MAAKFVSITKQIPWSLLLKAFFCGCLWLFAPFWLFVIGALFFYFVPLFRPWRFLFPFLTVFAISLLLPATLWSALFLGALFFLLLGVKDLVFVHRFQSYEAFVFLLFAAVFLLSFQLIFSWEHFLSFALIGIDGIVFVGAGASLLSYHRALRTPESPNEGGGQELLLLWTAGFLVWQLGIALLMLPLTFFSQTAILFVFSVLLLELFVEKSEGRLTRRTLFAYAAAFFLVVVFVLTAAEWGL